jgi:hypothetical protein
VDEQRQDLHQKLTTAQTELAGNLEALADKAKEAVDWHAHYRRHPSIWLGAALAGGFLMAAPLERRRYFDSSGYSPNVGKKAPA